MLVPKSTRYDFGSKYDIDTFTFCDAFSFCGAFSCAGVYRTHIHIRLESGFYHYIERRAFHIPTDGQSTWGLCLPTTQSTFDL